MVIKHGPFLPEEFIPLYDYVTLQEIGIQIPSSQIMNIALQHFINHEMHLLYSPNLEMYLRLTSAVIQFWQIGSSSSKLDSKSSSMLMMSRKISPTLVDIGSSNGTARFL